MNEIRKPVVVGWMSFDEAEERNIPDAGDLPADEFNLYVDSVVDYMKATHIKFSGRYHQCGEYGVPQFDNGMVLTMTQRKWGEVMAHVLEIDNSNGFAYVKWAWFCPGGDKEVYPYQYRHDAND